MDNNVFLLFCFKHNSFNIGDIDIGLEGTKYTATTGDTGYFSGLFMTKGSDMILSFTYRIVQDIVLPNSPAG